MRRCGALCRLHRFLASLAALLPARVSGEATEARCPGTPPRLHVVTFMDRVDRRLAYLEVSAQKHGVYPIVIGYGADAWWPDGLGTKINALRAYVRGKVQDKDIVIFVDAFDVLVMANENEIVAGFEELERHSKRSLVFNAEEWCFPKIDGICDEDTYPASPYRWRYLNAGLIAGRGHALKAMLRDPVPDIIRGSDQAWYQHYFKNNSDSVVLDTSCFFLCALSHLTEEGGAEFNGSHILVTETGSVPRLVHAVSLAHWPTWMGDEPTTELYEVFRRLFPAEASRLLHGWHLDLYVGASHIISIYHGTAWLSSMRLVTCLECRLLGSRNHECENFPSLLHRRCLELTLLLLFLLAAAVAMALWLWPLAQRLRHGWAARKEPRHTV